jgi:hypothetical protein
MLDCQLPGRSRVEVIRRLGQPDQEFSLGERHLRLSYWLGDRGNLKIDFLDGKVSSLAHDAWQTGVQEDDIAGPVGP